MPELSLIGKGCTKNYIISYDQLLSITKVFLEKNDYQFREDNFFVDYPHLVNDDRVQRVVGVIQRKKEREKIDEDYTEPEFNEDSLEQQPDKCINDEIRTCWAEYRFPKGYAVNESGIIKVTKKLDKKTGDEYDEIKDVCRTPFILCGISKPLDNESVYYKIRYADYQGNVKEFWANQTDLASKKELKVLLNSKGINCPENNLLTEALECISKFRQEFDPGFRQEISVKQNGWNDDRFIWGNRAITKDGVESVLALRKFPELDFKGDVNTWAEGVKDILGFDVARFKFYDAMTAPLLKKLNIEPHCTDHHNNTSHGKTLTSMLALSAVGYPKGLMIGAKSTAKGILVSVRDYSDLPFLVDETSDVNDDFSDVIYTLTSGKGRVKSTKDGERDGGELYRTSTMFTGENPIRDYLPKSGQQFRVIELNDVIPNMPTQKIDEIKDVMENNYGHIIIPFIQEICKNDIKKIYKDCFALLPKTVNNIEGRSKSIFACIMVAGILLEKIFKEIGIPERDPVKIVNKYLKECIQDNPIELEWMRALRVINDWAIADHNKFEDGIEELKFNVVGKISFEYIDIIGTEFTNKMKECGFSATAIKKQLFENGISICTSSRKDGNYTVNVNNKPAAGIRIIRKVMAEKLELSKDIPDWCIGYTRKVLETVIFLCKMRGSASLKQIQEIVGFTHRLGYSIIDSLEKLEQTNLIVEKNGEYVSIVL